MMRKWLLGFCGRLYVLALARDLAEGGFETIGGGISYPDEAEVRRLAQRELSAIRESIEAHYDYQNREQRILTDRLARRFDLGQALNESAQRAIDQGAVPPPGYPTEKQKLALKVQEETLKERLKKSL